jgi:hypothetical protein
LAPTGEAGLVPIINTAFSVRAMIRFALSDRVPADFPRGGCAVFSAIAWRRAMRLQAAQ